MLKVIRAAIIITFLTALATFLYAQHNHGATSDSDAKATCSCCAGMKDGKMAACCDADKCKMDAQGNCESNACCKKSGANACGKACAKAGDTAKADDHAAMSCKRKGGCCGGSKAAGTGGVQ